MTLAVLEIGKYLLSSLPHDCSTLLVPNNFLYVFTLAVQNEDDSSPQVKGPSNGSKKCSYAHEGREHIMIFITLE